MISAQFESPKRVKQYCLPVPDCYSDNIQLCAECNVNQEIKIKLLAEFIPFNENNFIQECGEYKKHLENEYKLCYDCETNVKIVLSKPINSNEVLNKNCSNSVTNPSVDSVFVRQNSKQYRNKYSFKAILFLEIISLICAIIILIFTLNELQNKVELTLRIDFPEIWTQYLDIHSSKLTFMIYSGFMSSMIALLICGKQSFQIADLFLELLWISVMLIETPLLLRYMDQKDALLFRPILSLFLIIFSSINSMIRLFAFFGTNPRVKQNRSEVIENKYCLKNSTNSEPNVCSAETQMKSCSENNVNSNRNTDQSIREQIKSLCIVDGTEPQLKSSQKQFLFSNENIINKNFSIKSSLIYENNICKNIVLPAKFHYESIAQTSWSSPFKPNTSPRKDFINSSPYLMNSQKFATTSHWINQQMSGLMTPPASATNSLSGKSYNRYNLF